MNRILKPQDVSIQGTSRSVMHATAAEAPDYRFEWHASSNQVYVVKKKLAGLEVADLIADRIGDPRLAQIVIATWCHGYLVGQGRAKESA